jgi:curved DNA-binding protein CbpA
MAAKTLYDILELSSSASPDAVRAAYERLSVKHDPDREENRADPDARIRHEAVKEAFLSLSNPRKRAEYDKKQALAEPRPFNVEVVEPFWTLPKVIVLVALLIFGGGYYYKHKQAEAKAAVEKAIAAAKAKEAEEQARLEAEQARLAYQQQRDEQLEQARLRREQEIQIRQLNAERRTNTTIEQFSIRREAMDQRRVETQRQVEERRAAMAAQQRADRERAELCRIERERYGKSFSC